MTWRLIFNSLLVATGATLLALIAGVGVAVFAAGLRARGRQAVMLAGGLALALPPFLTTNCWLHLLGQTGIWRGWLPFDIYSLGGAVWILGLLLWPVSMFLALAAWSHVPAALVEAEPALAGGRLIGALLLPAGRNALTVAALMTLVLALGQFAVPAILQVKVLPAEVWVQFSTNLDSAQAAWLALPLVLAPALLGWVLARRSIPWPRAEGSLPAGLLRRRLGWWWRGSAIFAAGAVLLSVGLPLMDLAGSRRTWAEFSAAWAAGGPAIAASLQFAVITATLATVAGLALGRFRWAAPLWLFWLVPGVFLGIALIFLLNRGPLVPFYQSSGVVVLAFLLRYSGPAWQGARHARQSVAPALDEAARLEGATLWQRLSRVQWPQMAPLLAATWYVLYLLTLWDAETLLLIVPPGGETLALRIFNLLHYGHNAQVDALCLILLALAALPAVLWPLARRSLVPSLR